MEKQETPRQKKLNTVIQQEIASLIQDAIRKSSISNLMVSITKVKVTPDISMAKVYVSIFPNNKANDYLKNLRINKGQLKYDLSQKLKFQLRKIPELSFYLDKSLDYIDAIDRDLLSGENPIKNISSLESRQKR